MELTIATLSLGACLILSTHLVYLCYTPPTSGPPTKPYPKDRIDIFSFISRPQNHLIFPFILTWIYHIALTIAPSHRSSICLNSSLLNEDLFTWNWRTITYFTIIFSFATLRLAAYAQLGKNFTFHLAAPSTLTTTGVYYYIQHPSYVGLIAIRGASTFLLERLDGAAVCLMPRWLAVWSSQVRWLNMGLWVGLTGLAMLIFWMRVLDEEEMMKREFGKEWEVWHKKTKRFIPGII